MCLWLQNLADSSTALMSFILATAILLGARLEKVKANLKNLGWCAFGIGVAMLLFTVSTEVRATVAGLLNRDVTLTDRTVLWGMALESGTDPIFGEGFESFELTGKGQKMLDYAHTEFVHNGYLNEYLNTGWIGVLLLVGVLYAAGRNVTSQFVSGSRVGYLFLGLFWSGLLYNYTEVTFHRSNVYQTLLWFMIAYGPAVQAVAKSGAFAEQSEGRPAEAATLTRC